jgi:hypothetical protein
MERDKFTATVRALKQQVPFRPFTIVTRSGNRYEIDSGDAIVIRDGLALMHRRAGSRSSSTPTG